MFCFWNVASSINMFSTYMYLHKLSLEKWLFGNLLDPLLRETSIATSKSTKNHSISN